MRQQCAALNRYTTPSWAPTGARAAVREVAEYFYRDVVAGFDRKTIADVLADLDMSTSTGVLLDDGVFHTEIVSHPKRDMTDAEMVGVLNDVQLFLNGGRPDHYFKFALKDEPVKSDAVANHKVRGIVSGSMWHLIAGKMLLGEAMDRIYATHSTLPSAIGMSKFWGGAEQYEQFFSGFKYHWSADFSNLDCSVDDEEFKGATDFFAYASESPELIYALLYYVFDALIIGLDGACYRKVNGKILSGFFGTSMWDTLIVIARMCVCGAAILRVPLHEFLSGYGSVWVLKVYGDDVRFASNIEALSYEAFRDMMYSLYGTVFKREEDGSFLSFSIRKWHGVLVPVSLRPKKLLARLRYFTTVESLASTVTSLQLELVGTDELRIVQNFAGFLQRAGYPCFKLTDAQIVSYFREGFHFSPDDIGAVLNGSLRRFKRE